MLPKNPLGKTGLFVSAIGLGTVKFGRNTGVKYPEKFALPSDHDILALLDCCQSLGINLLDTAPAYGVSEQRLGKLLGNRRKDFVLSTKAGEEFVNEKSFFDFSPDAIQRSIERSLKRLQTDCLDIVLVHSNGEDEKIIQQTGAFETLQRLKEAGSIRAFGMSSKTVAGGKLAVKLSDVVMVTYNPAAIEEQPVIAEAHAQGKGVLIKKALMSGHASQVVDALTFVLQEPGISSVIIGTLSANHLHENAACVQGVNDGSYDARN